MPNVLKKKRRSSVTSTVVGEEDRPKLEPPPSPSSSRTAVSRRSSNPFKLSRKKSSDSDMKQSGSAQSSPSSLKVKLTESPIAQKVKRQIQRLDNALSHGRPTGSPRRAGPTAAVAAEAGPGTPEVARSPSLKARLRSLASTPILPSSITLLPTLSPSARKRTVSTRDGEGLFRRKQQAPRNRTISCPTALDPNVQFSLNSSEMSSESVPRMDIPASSLRSVEEEIGVKGVEGQDPLAPETVFGSSVPVVHVEEDVPDPFLIDEEGDAFSSGEDSASDHQRQATSLAAHDVSLSVPASPSPNPASQLPSPKPLPSLLLSPNVHKDVPPPPISDSEDEDEEVPDLYLPGLIIPTMFLPIPNTDPLTILLNKYIFPPESRPMRDVSGDWQHSDFHTLVMTNSWRALARMARDRIVSSDPADLNLILGLWHLRLSCLARLRLFNQTAAECTNLFSVLNSINPPESRAYLFERLLPFELEVMQTRLKYWAGDHMGYLDSLAALFRKCKVNARIQGKSDATTLSMWRERRSRVALIMASQMVEMKEFTAAARLLEPLCIQSDGLTSPSLRSAVARIYLQGGNLHMAAKHFALVNADPAVDERQKQMNTALLASAEGDWETASDALREMIAKDNEDYVAVNNLSVALLNQGKMKEGIEVLETALKASPSSVVVAEPFLFNLSTLYELRSNIGFENKRQLLVEVAKWSGDGLKATCLKLPTN